MPLVGLPPPSPAFFFFFFMIFFYFFFPGGAYGAYPPQASNPVAVAAEIAANEGVLGFWSGSRYNIYKVVVEVGIALVFV